MDEPDGVLGVSAIRLQEPSFREQIHDHESTGRFLSHWTFKWNSFMLYDGGASETSRDGLLKCLTVLNYGFLIAASMDY